MQATTWQISTLQITYLSSLLLQQSSKVLLTDTWILPSFYITEFYKFHNNHQSLLPNPSGLTKRRCHTKT